MACAIPTPLTPVHITRTNNKVRVPIPLPPSIRCGHQSCRGKRGSGPWTGEDRKKQLLDHLKLKHPENGVLNPIFFCTKCRLEFNNFITAGRHGRKCSGEANSISSSLDLTLRSVGVNSSISSGRRSSVRTVFPTPEIDGSKLILLYPGVPCQCPRCEWVTLTTKCNAMHSMARHLETRHSLWLEKFWRCSKCGFIEDGIKMRVHDLKCRPPASHPPATCISSEPTLSTPTSLSSQSEANTSEHSSPHEATPPTSHQEEDQDAEDAPNESWLFTLPQHDAEDASRVEDVNRQSTLMRLSLPLLLQFHQSHLLRSNHFPAL